MNYIKHYNLLINRAKDRELEGYKERHHIIPKCMNGRDSKDNLVELTGEEHYLAHLLLIKIFPDNISLIHAANMMVCKSQNHKEHRTNNKIYGWLKRKHSNAVSERQQGKGNSQYGTCWVSNLELKECIKIDKTLIGIYLQSGWCKLRIIDFNKYAERQKIKSKKYAKAGKTNPHWRGYYITPVGIFDNTTSAARENKCCKKTIYNRCYDDKDNGYDFIPKN